MDNSLSPNKLHSCFWTVGSLKKSTKTWGICKHHTNKTQTALALEPKTFFLWCNRTTYWVSMSASLLPNMMQLFVLVIHMLDLQTVLILIIGHVITHTWHSHWQSLKIYNLQFTLHSCLWTQKRNLRRCREHLRTWGEHAHRKNPDRSI